MKRTLFGFAIIMTAISMFVLTSCDKKSVQNEEQAIKTYTCPNDNMFGLEKANVYEDGVVAVFDKKISDSGYGSMSYDEDMNKFPASANYTNLLKSKITESSIIEKNGKYIVSMKFEYDEADKSNPDESVDITGFVVLGREVTFNDGDIKLFYTIEGGDCFDDYWQVYSQNSERWGEIQHELVSWPLITVDDDFSDIEKQIEIIKEYMSENDLSDVEYYTIADLNNNGRIELLLSIDQYIVDFYEISEDYQSLEKNGDMILSVYGTGSMTLKYYEYEDDSNNVYVGYGSGGCKYIYYAEPDGQMTSRMIHNPSIRPMLLDDGNNGVLVSDKDNRLVESEKAEKEYFADAIGKKIITLNWYEKNDSLDSETLLELYEKTSLEECPDMDEWDSLYGFTGGRIYIADKLDLSDDTFELFGECAMYLWKDADVSKGDAISSKGYPDFKEFLFFLYHNRAEIIEDYEEYEHRLSKVERNDFINLLKEVFNEQNPEKVIDSLPNKPDGEENIYYSLEDNCIYLEVGALGWDQLFYEVSNVEKNQDEYVITYAVFSDFSCGEGPVETVNVTIKEADNPYGYKFVSVKYAPEDLFDQFLKGEINATVLKPLEPTEWGWDYDNISTVDIDDLNVNHVLWSFMEYSEGERLDLDNDGENELVIDGPYGGMYLDAIDGNLYVFAAARGNAGGLRYAYYDDAYWIVYHDTTHGGRSCYWLYKYEGGDNVVDTMTLMGFWNSEEDKEFTFNGESITEDDYIRIHDEIFASK